MTRRLVRDYRTESRAYQPYHGVMVFRRAPNPTAQRIAFYTGAGLALVVVIVETLLR